VNANTTGSGKPSVAMRSPALRIAAFACLPVHAHTRTHSVGEKTKTSRGGPTLPTDVAQHSLERLVGVRVADGQERAVDAFEQQALAESLQRVDHARNARILAERDQARAAGLDALRDGLVVEQPDVPRQDLVQQRHVL